MPPRMSRASLPSSSSRPSASSRPTGRAPKKSKKRALDAFAIASHEPDRTKIRQHRLGESDIGRKKRPRDEEEEDEEEDGEGQKRKKRDVDEDVDEGSDSEGNTWTMGHVGDDDDSDIDSDEAFGESDEERFEGWVFRGSASNQKRGRPQPKSRKVKEIVDEDGDIDLDEGESADGEEESDEDDFGDEGIDLATALDQYEDSDEEEKPKKSKKLKKASAGFDDSEPSEEEDVGADGASDFSSSDGEDEEDDSDKIARLQNLISSLPAEDETLSKGARRVDVHESSAPSEFGVLRKVDIASFKPKVADPERKKALKLLQDDVKSSKRNDIARKLEAPLPKRQQDKLDRAVATEKANETLERWVDTVKQNRRAEHISFPLKHPSAGETMGESRLMPTTTSAPANELESTIQAILQQSGLSNGKDDEEKIQKWEELETKKIPLHEVEKRRQQLRMERDLLFREEVRAKRIKKIKSKAYRRVHRRERERNAEREKEALRADGVDVSEDEREHNDRRRAEERMGAKHRESKWAKGVKESGRAAWDEDARTGVTEMARRNEELRRRIEGKEVRGSDDEGSDLSSEEEQDEDDEEDGDNKYLQRQVTRLQKNPFSTETKGIGSMKFMQKAEASRQARNDEDVERMRRELAGEETPDEEEDENSARVGRRKFAPTSNTIVPAVRVKGSEFEERFGSGDEAEDVENDPVEAPAQAVKGLSNGTRKAATKSKPAARVPPSMNDITTDNPYLAGLVQNKKASKKSDVMLKAQDSITSTQADPKSKSNSKSKTESKEDAPDDDLPEPQISAPDADGWQTVTYNDQTDDEDFDDDEGIDMTAVLRNQKLTAKGFAGDDVEAEFLAEKNATIDDEADKIITTTLPGWGGWVGDNLHSSDKKKKSLKTTTKKKGIDPSKRKDAKLERVIINEKNVKKNKKYLASTLPFPFESREQYERSLRLPKGPEWTTKATFQKETKPRVLVKQGIIRPMSNPTV
ncbi:Utp14-domain-containing protein [Amniculicola lignicola CBS 123094]|uniref:Utp14-domain-containing protein n=1 Tax=Amniculicola lignicola CBS 123094 TaxID=1392246 RepID=A0A6A5WU16_9PLEO|nr:Utp14-domain-containing protein [Amniculicola lignicola CBS 123094]